MLLQLCSNGVSFSLDCICVLGWCACIFFRFHCFWSQLLVTRARPIILMIMSIITVTLCIVDAYYFCRVFLGLCDIHILAELLGSVGGGGVGGGAGRWEDCVY